MLVHEFRASGKSGGGKTPAAESCSAVAYLSDEMNKRACQEGRAEELNDMVRRGEHRRRPTWNEDEN